ncbi:MAG: hypothetical protein KIT11_06680 [Fimbriimonadaceae bacterium]|nr:hypothetical protein [Fimbriimonadaceae bacterium]QYK56038.1 MAG: hypothetical protein KF733_00870 [Fimbriimonadaceae bacterium]
MQTPIDPYAAHAKQSRNYLYIGLGMLVLAIVLGVGLSGILFKGQGVSGPATQAGEVPVAPVTQATAEPQPALQASQEVPPEMPQAILDWLKHLERIEKKRKDMSTEQMAGLLTNLAMLSGVGGTPGVMDGLLNNDPDALDKSPAEDIAQQAGVKRAEWNTLIDDFDSLPPPPECVPIRNAYAQALGETKTMVVEVLDAISQAGSDPDQAVKSLMKMRGTSSNRVDVSGRQTDDLVQEICDKYRKRKWFSIAGDIGGGMGNILGGLGGLGGR